MTTSAANIHPSTFALPLRKSLAVFLFGVVALFAQLNLEHNRHIQQGLPGQIESIPAADIALSLHKESGWQRLAAAAVTDSHSSDKQEKETSTWLALVAVDHRSYEAAIKSFFASAASFFYTSLPAQSYSPRAPPRI